MYDKLSIGDWEFDRLNAPTTVDFGSGNGVNRFRYNKYRGEYIEAVILISGGSSFGRAVKVR